MGKYHEEKIRVMQQYLGEIATGFSYHIKGDIPIKKMNHAISSFASGLDRTTTIGLYDTTVFGSGKNG